MGFFKSVLNAVPAYWIGDKLDVLGTNAKRDAEGMAHRQDELRRTAKDTQYGLLDQMKGPETSQQMKNRIKALEDESKATSLVEDPYFQGHRSTVVQGGQQALASVQNQQAAQGNSGGFSNQGSISDVYDRLGAQLSQLGQQSQQVKSDKAQMAAELEQSIRDGEIAFANAQTQARMAIEAGDAAAASQALNNAFLAKQQIEAGQKQMLLGMGQMAVGAMSGNPAAVAGGAQGAMAGKQNMNQGPTQQNMNTNLNQGMQMGDYGASTGGVPYWQMR